MRTSAPTAVESGRKPGVLIVNETPVAKDERCWLEARSLAEAGYRVSVVCPMGERGEPRHDVRQGVDIHAYPPPPQASGLWGYAWELTYCWLRSAAAMLALWPRFDVVHACNPPDTFFLLGALSRPFGKRYVFAQHDLCPELWLSRFGDRGALGRLLHWGLLVMERMSYRVADVVVVPNESYKRVAMERGRLAPEDVFVVRNGPDLDKVRMVSPDDALREGRRHLVCYLGIMNPQDGVDYLLRAAAWLVGRQGRTDTQFAMVGSGDVLQELETIADELGVSEHVTFTGWVSDPDLMSRYLCTADVCVAPDPDTPLNQKSSFMKIMDYMAAATPTVAFDLPETRVSAGDAALYAIPDDVADLASKIALLLDDPDLRRRMGERGRARVEEALSWRHCEPHLLAAYERVFARERVGGATARRPKTPDELRPQAAGAGAGTAGCPREGAAAASASTLAAAHVSVTNGLPLVRIDSTAGKREFLDFWKLPHSVSANGQAAVALLSADSLKTRHHNAVVLLPGSGRPGLFRTGNGCSLYASVFPIRSCPEDLSVVTPVLDGSGRPVSYVLEDRARNAFYVPFSLDEAFEGFHLERYARGRRFPPDAVLAAYYRLKPFFSQAARARVRRYLAPLQEQRSLFPEWPIDLSFERLKRFVLELLVRASKTGELPFVWFWPEGRGCCLVLTHDVESGLSDNEGVWRIIEAERSKGLRSSFNIVPFKYEVTEDAIDRLRQAGCEVGVHGYSHDGRLFRSDPRFADRAQEIAEVARGWDATGFRSSSTYRDPDLLGSMGFAYDSSFFDTDPYEPQPGGCLSLYPYFIGDMVEIPITLPQDYTLFVVREEEDIGIWRRKLAAIRELKGMACLDAHPDEGYIGDSEKVSHYLEFLDEVADDDDVWNPLPGELARWWSQRRAADIVPGSSDPRVDGSASGLTVRWARLDGDGIVFTENSGRRGR